MIVVRADGNVLVLEHRVAAFEDGDDVLRLRVFVGVGDRKVDALLCAQLKGVAGRSRFALVEDLCAVELLALKEGFDHRGGRGDHGPPGRFLLKRRDAELARALKRDLSPRGQVAHHSRIGNDDRALRAMLPGLEAWRVPIAALIAAQVAQACALRQASAIEDDDLVLNINSAISVYVLILDDPAMTDIDDLTAGRSRIQRREEVFAQ